MVLRNRPLCRPLHPPQAVAHPEVDAAISYVGGGNGDDELGCYCEGRKEEMAWGDGSPLNVLHALLRLFDRRSAQPSLEMFTAARLSFSHHHRHPLSNSFRTETVELWRKSECVEDHTIINPSPFPSILVLSLLQHQFSQSFYLSLCSLNISAFWTKPIFKTTTKRGEEFL